MDSDVDSDADRDAGRDSGRDSGSDRDGRGDGRGDVAGNSAPRLSSENCSITRTLALVGERWTLLIMREAFLGVRRFGEFRSRLGVAGNLLTTRLETLVQGGVLERVPYREPGGRERHEYRLTERGLDLMPILVALRQWGDKHLADPAGPSVVLRHEPPCDQPAHLTLVCAAGHDALDARTTVSAPGPGALFR